MVGKLRFRRFFMWARLRSSDDSKPTTADVHPLRCMSLSSRALDVTSRLT